MQIHRVLSIKYSTEGDHVLSPTTSIRLFIATRILAMKKHRLILSLFFSFDSSIDALLRNFCEGNGARKGEKKRRKKGREEERKKEGEEVVVSQTVRKRLTRRIKWYRNETIVEQMPGHKTTASSFPPPIALSTPAEKAN